MYTRGVYALRDLTLTIGKGDFVFLTGPSGAGKSTLLRLLLRQDIPSAGHLIVGGRSVSKMSASQVQTYRRSVGFVFQDFKLIPTRTVYENITFVPAGAGPAHRGAAAQGVPGPEVGRAAASAERVSRGTVGRRAAAGRRGACAHQRPGAGVGRRADRQPRPRSRARDHEPVSRHQRRRHDGAGGDPRSRAHPPCRQAHRDTRPGPARGGRRERGRLRDRRSVAEHVAPACANR